MKAADNLKSLGLLFVDGGRSVEGETNMMHDVYMWLYLAIYYY